MTTNREQTYIFFWPDLNFQKLEVMSLYRYLQLQVNIVNLGLNLDVKHTFYPNNWFNLLIFEMNLKKIKVMIRA